MIVARSVTLEVSPEQAQKLTLAQTVGTISLALHNQAYTMPAAQRTITVRDLSAGEINQEAGKTKVVETKPAPRSVAADPGIQVRIRRGTEGVSEYEVRRDPAAR